MAGFNTKIQESIKRYQGKVHPIDKIGYKLRAYELADKVGVKHAKVYRQYCRIEYVKWDSLPDRFVIKPKQGCSGSGVLPLIKEDKRYRNLLKKCYMTREEVMLYFLNGTIGEKKHSMDLWIEELLSDPLPYDWKIHTFNGKIGIIEQFKRDEENKYHKYWTREWQPIKNMCKKIFTYHINNSLPPPEHGKALLKAAEVLSKAIGHPFVRIDLYDTPRGVFIGEITPHPGRTCIYIEYWEKYLGEMWEKAEGELQDERRIQKMV